MRTTPLRKPRPASPAKDPYKRRSWESDEDYNDRVQQMDAKSQQDLAKEQEAIDAANEYDARYSKMASTYNSLNRDYTIREKLAQANRLEKEYDGMKKATDLLSQSKDTANLDVATAYKNQEQKKQERVNDKLHDANLMLKSLETATSLWGIGQFVPYMYMKYGPQFFSYIGRQFAKRGLVNQTRQLIMPQIDRSLAAQTARNGDALRFAEMTQDANQYAGGIIDAAQIYTQPNARDKFVNAAELVPLAFDKVNNKYARLFSNIGGFAANIYDVYSNLNE